MIYKSKLMAGILEEANQLRRVNATVLITGESGTGKELVAKHIHGSQTQNKPFVALNCHALPSELVESMLFGHTKGSFTGACTDSIGLFEKAKEGTAFLDEIGQIRHSTQAKLLRVLQEREFTSIGANHKKKLNCRIIAATNEDIEADVRRGKFRMDLFFRLNVYPIQIPPLRERPEDIEVLIEYFLKMFGGKYHFRNYQITGELKDALMQYKYPGNVRELGNIIERMCIRSFQDCVLDIDLLPDNIRNSIGRARPQDRYDYYIEREKFERNFLTQALSMHDGNIQRVSRHIGLSRPAIRDKINRYGINIERFKPRTRDYYEN
jgi:transcriptional regulator with PAS, ATPase and Fis domain